MTSKPGRPDAEVRSGPFGESWRAWIALVVGVLAVSAHSALSYGMSPLLKPITDELRWTRSEYAAAMNFRMLLLMLIAPFAGQLVDRLGARFILSGGALLMGIGTFGLAGVHSLGGLYGWNSVIGPGQACIGSVAGSALVLRLFRRRRGLAIGILNGGDNFITSWVHVTSAALLVSAGWRGALSALGVGYLVLAILVFAVLRTNEGGGEVGGGEGSPDAPGESTTRGGRSASLASLPWSDPALWLLLGSYVPIYAFITSIGIHFPAFERDLGRDPELASYIYGLTTVIGAFGSVAFGWFAERTSARGSLVLVVAGLAATSVCLWTTTSVGAAYAWAVAYGVVNAGAVALLALVLDELFGAAQIGTLMGVAMVFCMAGTIAGNSLAAAIFDHFGGYVVVWQIYTALMLCTLVPVEILRRRAHPRAA